MNSRQADAYYQSLEMSSLVETEQHHEFRDGLHGFKMDFEAVAPFGSKYFDDGVELMADYIADEHNYPRLPSVLIGVANGANQLAMSVAEELGPEVKGIQTSKAINDRSRLQLPVFNERQLIRAHPMFALVLDDVGTSGSSTAQVANLCSELKIPQVEALYLIQRSAKLRHLGEIGIKFQAVIYKPMDNFTAEECQQSGPCSEPIELVRHPNRN